MTIDVSDKQNKINDVIDDFGTPIILSATTAENYSEDVGWSISSGSGVSHNAIPYDYFESNKEQVEQGNLPEGSIRLIIKGNVSIDQNDTFTYNSKTYVVTKVNPLPLANKQTSDALAQVIDASEQI